MTHGRRHQRGLVSFLRHQSGTSAVEAALVLPLLLSTFLFVVEFGRVLYAKLEFEYAVNVATRLGMVQKTADAAAVKKAVGDHMMLLDAAKLGSFSFTERTNADNSKTATLTGSYRVEFLLPVTKTRSVTLSRTVSFLRPQ